MAVWQCAPRLSVGRCGACFKGAKRSGTRDLYLSNTVRMHRKLRAAGVEAVLQSVRKGNTHVPVHDRTSLHAETEECRRRSRAIF